MIGTQLGAYRLEEVIGRGGMGVVYRATDTRLGRTVAVKLLPTRTGADGAESPRDPELTRRFLKEAQAASALNHPNIVTLFDVGRQDDVDFIVMEFVSGRTLAERLRGAPVSIPEAASIARQLAGALAAAHAAGIVHRDLKPGNLMLGEDGRLRVLDFGLARMTVSEHADTEAMTLSAALTHPGTLIGTPAYMAPEQIEGAAADARSDIHAFGVILYELLTGVQPFRDSSLTAMAHAIVYREPPPISGRRPEAPRALVRLIERCLAKSPGERFADGGELAAALAPVARDIESGAAGAPSLSRRVTEALVDFRAGVRRRRGVRAGIGVAVVAAAALIAWSTLPDLRERVRTRLSSTIPGLAPTPYALYQSGMTDLARYFETGRIDRAIATFQQAVTEDPSYAPGYVGLAEAHWRRFRENRDPAILTRAVGHAREAVRLDPQLVSARVTLGLVLIEERDFAAARDALTGARQLDPANARAYRGLGSLALAEGNPAAADSAFTRAIELAPDDWEIRTQRGVLYLVTGEHAKALADFEETARLSPDNHLVHRNVGGAQHMLGRFADAAASFQKSLAIKPDPAVYSNLGTIYYFQGLYAQAVAALERSVELGPNNATIWRNLGDSYRQVPGREDRAAQAYRRAAQLLREELGSVPGDPILTAELALCLAREGNPAGREEARRLITALDSSWRGIPEAAYALVLALETLGDRAAALDALEAALAAGHPVDEVGRDPELVDLRRDPAYHRLLADVDRP